MHFKQVLSASRVLVADDRAEGVEQMKSLRESCFESFFASLPHEQQSHLLSRMRLVHEGVNKHTISFIGDANVRRFALSCPLDRPWQGGIHGMSENQVTDMYHKYEKLKGRITCAVRFARFWASVYVLVLDNHCITNYSPDVFVLLSENTEPLTKEAFLAKMDDDIFHNVYLVTQSGHHLDPNTRGDGVVPLMKFLM